MYSVVRQRKTEKEEMGCRGMQGREGVKRREGS